MKNIVLMTFCCSLLVSCNDPAGKKQSAGNTDLKTGSSATGSVILFKTDQLVVEKLSDHVYRHESYLSTKDFGKVSCNGMVVVNQHEALVFDTPASEESSVELINYLTGKLNKQVIAVVATHFHEDCVAGLDKFFAAGIPAYANTRTISFLEAKHRKFSKQIQGFDGRFSWNIGDKKVYAQYFGEGHTRDNIVGYFPDDNAIFGGCLVKEINASKGNLEDANTVAWPGTVQKVKQQYPAVKIVVPGHGKWGGPELFDYTIDLFTGNGNRDN